MQNISLSPHFSTVLLQWFKVNGRSLPWRKTNNPYAIWLSEIILQQTRVQQGWDYWHRFMEHFPRVEDLANASEDEVLRLWQGLGYYSRARNLHFAAKQVVRLGHFPNTLSELKKLKGVGDYTAAAIGSIAFGLPLAVVDGNVYRVLARYFGIDTPIDTTEGKKQFAALAQLLLPVSHASAYNQAIMDFGAIQCTPTSPRCLTCPLSETCQALRIKKTDTLPIKLKKIKIKHRQLTYIYIRCKDMVAIHRRGEGDIWQGLWEPLLIENQPLPIFGVPLQLIKSNIKHVLTHQILIADFYLLETSIRPILPKGYIWIKELDLDKYAVPRLVEIMLETIDDR